MSGILEEAIALASDQDISVPAFVQINPVTGEVGLSYVAIAGNALGPGARYLGVYNGIRGAMPITTPLQLGDEVDLVAADVGVAPHEPLQLWRGRWQTFQNPSGNRFNIVGGTEIFVDRNTAGDLVNPNGAWILDPNLGTITCPYTGLFRITSSGWWGTSNNINSHTDAQGLWYNGAFDVELASHAFAPNENNFSETFAWEVLASLTRGDTIGLAWFSNAGNINLNAINRTLSLRPIWIANS